MDKQSSNHLPSEVIVEVEASDVSVTNVKYVGFWARVLASIIDTVFFVILLLPLQVMFPSKVTDYFDDSGIMYGMEFGGSWREWALYAIVIIGFWFAKRATPGKMVVKAQIVDRDTLSDASKGQLVGRYFAYIVSSLPLGLGFLWVAFDRKKRGFHDMLASTVVVHKDSIAQK